MASSRKSVRRSPLGKAVKFGAVALVLGGIGLGVYWFAFRDAPAEQSEGEALIGLEPQATSGGASYERARGAVVGGGAQVVGDVDGTAAAVRSSLAGKTGPELHTAMVDGHARLAALLEQPLPVKMRERLLPDFHAISSELFFSNIRNEFSQNYIVQSGDSVARIAKKHGVTEELVCQWNNIAWEKRTQIHVGDSFKIVKGKPTVIVDKSDFCLSFYFGDKLAWQFIIAHGKGNNTPEGSSTVTTKVVDPDKTPNAGPRQLEMRERWMGLANYAGRSGIGLHGTREEDSIPGETSHGCVRMFNRDVVELYKWLPYGATVTIRA